MRASDGGVFFHGDVGEGGVGADNRTGGYISGAVQLGSG